MGETSSGGDMAERRGYEGSDYHGGESAEPDVLLDVPQLRVEEISLDVEQLHAHVSVEADVLNLLRLSIGVDAELSGVHLEIKGVEAQVLLKVRLDKIAEIIDRVLTTIDHHPEIVGQVVPPLQAAAGELGQAAGRSGDELAGTATTAAGGVESSASKATGETTINDTTTQGGQSGEVAAKPDDSSAERDQEASRGFLRRRKQQRTGEEPPS
jgi:hypothetical protein